MCSIRVWQDWTTKNSKTTNTQMQNIQIGKCQSVLVFLSIQWVSKTALEQQIKKSVSISFNLNISNPHSAQWQIGKQQHQKTSFAAHKPAPDEQKIILVTKLNQKLYHRKSLNESRPLPEIPNRTIMVKKWRLIIWYWWKEIEEGSTCTPLIRSESLMDSSISLKKDPNLKRRRRKQCGDPIERDSDVL